MDCAWWLTYDRSWRNTLLGTIYTIIRCCSPDECDEVVA